jgi:NADPH-dependent 2,4-dienoyl-CoA reductase/sulfur reductase-like enzyme
VAGYHQFTQFLFGRIDLGNIVHHDRDGIDPRLTEQPQGAGFQWHIQDIVLVATGGLPNTDIVDGADLVVSTWDILSGDVKPGERVLIYDDNAAHQGLSAGEVIAHTGAQLEIVTPERFFAADIGGLNHVAYAQAFDRSGARITINKRVLAVRRSGNGLIAEIGSDYSERIEEREVDQVVVEHGTLPLDGLYFDLKPGSSNGGEVDYDALIAGRPQTVVRNPEGPYRLFRIGDAVASRNIHAAIYDAIRLAKDF